MKTCVHLWYYLAEFFFKWEMSRIKVVDKIKTHILHRGADKSLARRGRKQAKATEDFDVYISYLLS
jgi:hypothetical protein